MRNRHGFPRGEKRSARRPRPRPKHGACPGPPGATGTAGISVRAAGRKRATCVERTDTQTDPGLGSSLTPRPAGWMTRWKTKRIDVGRSVVREAAGRVTARTGHVLKFSNMAWRMSVEEHNGSPGHGKKGGRAEYIGRSPSGSLTARFRLSRQIDDRSQQPKLRRALDRVLARRERHVPVRVDRVCDRTSGGGGLVDRAFQAETSVGMR